MTQTPFSPVFGPNGAVLNAASMTPEMRAKIDEAARPPSAKRVLRELWPFVVIGVAAVAGNSMAPALLAYLQSSPWLSGFAIGVVATLLVVALLRAASWSIRRWELATSADARRLSMPSWARWTLSATDLLMVTGYCLMMAGFLINPIMPTGIAYMVALLVAAVFGALSLVLRYAADKLGWTWRVAA